MSADLAKIRNWNREQQAQRIAELEQQRDELLAALTEIRNLSRTTSAEIYATAFAAVDRLHASLKELDK